MEAGGRKEEEMKRTYRRLDAILHREQGREALAEAEAEDEGAPG